MVSNGRPAYSQFTFICLIDLRPKNKLGLKNILILYAEKMQKRSDKMKREWKKRNKNNSLVLTLDLIYLSEKHKKPTALWDSFPANSVFQFNSSFGESFQSNSYPHVAT